MITSSTAWTFFFGRWKEMCPFSQFQHVLSALAAFHCLGFCCPRTSRLGLLRDRWVSPNERKKLCELCFFRRRVASRRIPCQARRQDRHVGRWKSSFDNSLHERPGPRPGENAPRAQGAASDSSFSGPRRDSRRASGRRRQERRLQSTSLRRRGTEMLKKLSQK